MNDNLRLFTALRFKKETLEEIGEIQNLLKKIDPSAKYIKPINNFHETLYFIGMVQRSQLKIVQESFKEACNIYKDEINQPIKIIFTKLGEFKRSNGNIVWLGAKENIEMRTLANLIPDILKLNGINIKKNNFTAHITLARKFHGKLPENIHLPNNINIEKASLVWSHRNENNVLIYDNIVEYPITNNFKFGVIDGN